MDKKHQPLFAQIKEKASESFISTLGKKLIEKLVSSVNAQKQWSGIDKQLERKELILQKCRKIKKILAPSQFMKNLLVENDYNESQIDVLPLGFNIPLPKGSEKKHSDKLRIGYIGTINMHKGVHLLIQALRGIPSKDVELKIYGDFTRFHKYTQYVRNLASHDKRISFHGTFKPELIQQTFEEIDVLAIPSLWYENIPTAAYMALAHKVPVIAPSFGALPEIIRDGQNGLLFNRNDPDDLKEKIASIVDDTSILERLSEKITPPKTIFEHAEELSVIFENYTYCDKV